MSYILFMPFVSVLSLRIMDYIASRKRPYYFYLLFYGLMISCAYILPIEKAHADEIPETDFIEFYESSLSEKKLTPDMRQVYWRVATQCRKEGYAYMYEADHQSLLIPNVTLKEFAHTAITSAVAALPASTPQEKVVQALLVFLCTYLCKVYDNWEDIQYNLQKAETCFKNADFYTKLIEQG